MQATWIARRVVLWLRETADGRVHSRFRSVLNLAWGEHLITLALPDAGRLPGGVLLDPVTFQGEWPGVQGDPVSFETGTQTLHFPGGTIALGGAVQEGADRAPLASVDPERLAQNLQTLVRLTRLSGKGELVPLLDANAPPFGLSQALAEGDGPALVAAARPLLGRGQGLTPACDDLLLGFTAVAWFAGPALPVPARRALAQLSHSLAESAPQRTTAISANYLILAADGGWSERLADSAIALLSASGPALVAPILRLLAFGHTSGHDTAVGLGLGGATVSHLIAAVGGNRE